MTDPCLYLECPEGTECQMGYCVGPGSQTDGGPPDAGDMDAGLHDAGADPGITPDQDQDGGAGDSAGDPESPPPDNGCGCSNHTGKPAVLALLIGLTAMLVRRRRHAGGL